MINNNLVELCPRKSIRQEIEDEYSHLLTEDLRLGTLVSYISNKKIPILRLYRYKEAFSYKLINEFIRRFGLDSSDVVLDPFSGMGTTIFTCMLNKIPSIGVDKLPLAYFLSNTFPLFLSIENGEMRKKFEEVGKISKKIEPALIAEDVPIITKAFGNETLKELQKIKAAIETLDSPYREMFLLLFFSILEDCSFTSKDGQFLRLVRDKEIFKPLDALNKKVSEVESDIIRLKTLFAWDFDKNYLPKTCLADSKELSKFMSDKATAVITSPPYLNRYDYTRSYALELCFHFVKNAEELKKIRFDILRSHIESKSNYEDDYFSHPAVAEIIKELNKKKLNNPRIPIMVKTYFADMEQVIGELSKVLTDGAKVAMVVDNVRFEGELIPVDLILSDIAKKYNFTVRNILIARYKGNSSQQMGKYGRVPVRESILVWEQ